MHLPYQANRTTFDARFSVSPYYDLMYLAFRDENTLFGEDTTASLENSWWRYGPVFRTFSSTSFSSFFRTLVRWLEAIHLGADRCAFGWDGEGPDGELSWSAETRNVGQMRLSWDGGRGVRRCDPVNHSHRLRREELVRVFYRAYLDLIASDRFDRRHFVNFTLAEVLDYRFDEPVDAVLAALVQLEADDAATWLDVAVDGMDREKPIKLSLRSLQRAGDVAGVSLSCPPSDAQDGSPASRFRSMGARAGSWIREDVCNDAWRTGSLAERMARLQACLDEVAWRCNDDFDGPLEKILPRSSKIEDWLARHDESASPAKEASHG
mgnify:CR=1 FL=1